MDYSNASNDQMQDYDPMQDNTRKRKYENESRNDNYSKNRRPHGYGRDEDIFFKVLVPSYAAGGIIGKGGERIAQIQKETGVKMKMSKNNDFYPGTTERVCLMNGSLHSIIKAHEFLMAKIQDKPENYRHEEGRENQTRVLIPNSCAGLLIGKGGSFIKQIKDDSGAFVQISHKDSDLTERIVTIEGDHSKRNRALEMVLKKICEDPQYYDSSTNISYLNVQPGGGGGSIGGSMSGTGGQSGHIQNGSGVSAGMGYQSNLAIGLQNKLAELLVQNASGASNSAANNNLQLSGLNNLSIIIMNCGGIAQMTLDSLKNALRAVGYTPQAITDITNAINMLITHGLIAKSPQVSSSNTTATAVNTTSDNTSSVSAAAVSLQDQFQQANLAQTLNAATVTNQTLNQSNLGSLLQLLTSSLGKTA